MKKVSVKRNFAQFNFLDEATKKCFVEFNFVDQLFFIFYEIYTFAV